MATSLTVPAGAANLFKEIYGDEFLVACPEHRECIDTFRFETADAPGKIYKQGIRMTEEQGFTFRAGGSEAGTLRDPVALHIENASILGSVLEFRSRVDIDVFEQAMTSKQAFKEAVGLRQEAQRDSIMKHLEWSLLQGGRTLGVITNVAAGSSATEKIVTISDATWVSGWWAGAENMPLDIFTTESTSTSIATQATATKRNTSSATAKFSVVSVNFTDKKVTLNADAAGDWASVVATDALWRVSEFVAGTGSVVSPGLIRLSEFTSGTVNGISTSYGLWKGIQNSSGGTITMSRILKTVAEMSNRSTGKRVFTVRLGSLSWEQVNSDLSAMRRYDGSYERTKGYNGFSEIVFYSPNGEMRLRAHPFMRESEVHISDDDTVTRRGPTDVRFTLGPTGEQEQMYILRQDSNQYEFRAYSNQALLNVKPARSAIFTGLTVPSLA
jgi:hypothetical protein